MNNFKISVLSAGALVRLIGTVLSYMVLLTITKKFGLSGAGTYGILSSSWNSFAIISGLGINLSITQIFGRFDLFEKGLYIKTFLKLIGIVISIGVFIPVFLSSFDAYVGNALSLKIPWFSCLAVPFLAVFALNLDILKSAGHGLISEAGKVFIRPIVLLVLIGFFDEDVRLENVMLTNAITVGLLSFLAIVLSKNTITKSGEDIATSKIYEITRPMFTSSLLSILMGQGLIWIYGMQSGDLDQVGTLTISIRISQALGIVLISSNTLTAPKLSKAYWENDFSSLSKTLDITVKFIVVVSIIASFLILFFGDDILYLFGVEFNQVDLGVFWFLITLQLVNNITGPASLILNIVNGQDLLRRITMYSAGISLIGYTVGFLSNQPLVIIAGYGGGLIFLNISASYNCFKHYGIKTFVSFKRQGL